MEAIIVYAGVLAVLTVAFVQLIRKTTSIPDKLMTLSTNSIKMKKSISDKLMLLFSLLIGLLVGIIALFIPEITSDLSVGGHLLAGAISGLSASGIYDLATKTGDGINESNKGN